MVIITKLGDRYHTSEGCYAFQQGRRMASRLGNNIYPILEVTKVEALGLFHKKPCKICRNL